MDGFFSKASSYLSSQADEEAPPAASHGDSPAHKQEETRKPASSGGYGDLFAGAQALMNSAKPSGSDDGEEKPHKAAGSGGYGDLLASAQSFVGSAKKDKASSGGGAQSMMGSEGAPAHKKEAGDGDMGEMAGAAANLIGAAARYGNLEKSAYGEYAHKAETYLHGYQASHARPTTAAAVNNSEEDAPPARPTTAVNSAEDGPPARRHRADGQQDE